jgi:Rod binding domain-containing protein
MEPLTALADMQSLTPRAAPDLASAAREFESYLVGAMLRQGTRPLFGETPLDGGSAGRMYREQLLDEVARVATFGNGFGVGDLLEGPRPPALDSRRED